MNHLSSVQNGLLCGSTITLNQDGDRTSELIGYGAYWNFETLSIHWITKFNKMECHNSRVEIPCILEASYACSRDYWLKLKGLEGLLSYGLDEQYISLKNWFLGGSSYVMTGVHFGHKFRDNATVPYQLSTPDFIQNMLLVTEIFYDLQEQGRLLAFLEQENGADNVFEHIEYLERSKERILAIKNYFHEHQQKSFREQVAFNSKFEKSQE